MKRTILLSFVILFLPCVSIPIQAQLVNAYQYPDDQKHYTIKPVNGLDDYVVAGTIYYDKGKTNHSAIHFQYYSGTTITIDKKFEIPNSPDGLNDVRVATILPDQDGNFHIIYLVRDNLNVANGWDRTAILSVDPEGNVMNNVVLSSVVSQNLEDMHNIIPINAIIENDEIFICGFVNNSSYKFPDQPGYACPLTVGFYTRQALILKYNINNGSTAAKIIDTYVPVSNPIYQFDIGIRLRKASNGNILMTGSCNVINSGGTESSGTCLYEFDPATLTLVNSILLYGPNGPTFGEYGVDILEDAAYGGYFVLSNYFELISHLQTNKGFFPYPTNFCLTFVDYSFNFVNNPNRSKSGGGFALQFLPSPSAGKTLIAGMGFSGFPFITEIVPQAFPYTWWSQYSFKSYPSVQGVGSFSSWPGYWIVGGGFANAGWNPLFCTVNPNNPNGAITMTAPILNTNPFSSSNPVPLLNYKLIQTDNNGDLPGCLPVEDWAPTQRQEEAFISNWLVYTTYFTSVTNLPVIDAPYPYFSEDNCSPAYYRLTKTLTKDSVAVYPNPARSFENIKVDITSVLNTHKPDERVTIMMNRANGPANLIFDGYVAEASGKYTLKPLNPGFYIVTIKVNATLYKSIKLVVS